MSHGFALPASAVRSAPPLFRPHDHEHLPLAFGDQLVVLVIGAVVELDDAGAWPRLRFAFGQNFGGAMHGIAFEQRMRKLHLRHAEIGDGGADRHVGDLNAVHIPKTRYGLEPLCAAYLQT